MDDENIKYNEFIRLSLLNLFIRIYKLNNINKLIDLFSSAPPNLQRKIILAAYISKAESWIRELREKYPTMNSWCKRAMIIATKILQKDEKKYILNIRQKKLNKNDYMEQLLIKWAKT
ncbi:MAG: hypothetical protein ACTSQO_11245 [Candidatus Helarchaeota archaeon]